MLHSAPVATFFFLNTGLVTYLDSSVNSSRLYDGLKYYKDVMSSM